MTEPQPAEKADLALEMCHALLGAYTALVGVLVELALEREVPKSGLLEAMQRLDTRLDATIVSDWARGIVQQQLAAVYAPLRSSG